MRVVGWLAAGVGLGAASLLDPLGMLVAIIVLGVLIGFRWWSDTPGLLLVGAGIGATLMLELAERSYAGTVPLGVSLSLAVVLIGGVWIYFSTVRGRKQRLSPDPTAAPPKAG